MRWMVLVCWILSLYRFSNRLFLYNTYHPFKYASSLITVKSSDPSMAQETDPEQVFEILERMGEG